VKIFEITPQEEKDLQEAIGTLQRLMSEKYGLVYTPSWTTRLKRLWKKLWK